MIHNADYYANALIKRFHGLPKKALCTAKNCKEIFKESLERYGKIRYNEGKEAGRLEMALEIKRGQDYPGEYCYKTRRWVEIEIGRHNESR